SCFNARAADLLLPSSPTRRSSDLRHVSGDSLRFAYEILEGCHVAVTPGVAFGRNAEGYLRFSYAASVERIQEGLRRLGTFLAGRDRKSTRLNSSHVASSYAVFCLK